MLPQTNNDHSLPYWVTVQRNDGSPKFYSGTSTLEEAIALTLSKNTEEESLRSKRAAQHARPVVDEDTYTYKVKENASPKKPG